MEHTFDLEMLMFTELSTFELMSIDGGVNWDHVVEGIAGVVAIVGAIVAAPAVVIGATLFVTAYKVTRAFGS